MCWEPAESGSQQAVGRSGGLLACFCQHADEVIPGMQIKIFFKYRTYMIILINYDDYNAAF